MAQDPGPTVQVQVAPVGMVPAVPQTMATMPAIQTAPAITTIHSSTEYVPYAAPAFIGPIVIGLPVPVWRQESQQRHQRLHRHHGSRRFAPDHSLQHQQPRHWR
jgi:hypothetical protein